MHDAFSNLQVTARNSDWFIVPFAPVMTGQSYHFGICFLTGIFKLLQAQIKKKKHIVTMKFNCLLPILVSCNLLSSWVSVPRIIMRAGWVSGS